MAHLTINTKTLAALDQDSPVTMINFLRYRDIAHFQNREELPCTGLEAYQRYAAKALTLVESMGASVRLVSAAAAVCAPEGESWDDIIIVDYPSVRSFIGMADSTEYQSFCYLREAALADTRLIACQGNASFALPVEQ